MEIVQEPPKKGRPFIAWTVILSIVVLLIAYPRPEAREGRAVLMIAEFQGKMLVGAADVLSASGGELLAEAQVLNVGPVMNRLCFVVLAGELSGPQAALDELESLGERMRGNGIEPHEIEKGLLEALAVVYRDYADKKLDAPSLDDSQRSSLREELNWFGRLALAPKGGPDRQEREAVIAAARRTMYVVFGAMAVLIVLAAGGLIGTGTFAVLYFSGELRSQVKVGSPFGGVYAETFAAWFALFLVLGLGTGLAFGARHELVQHLFVFGLSLSSLAWPVVRGIPWRQFRREIGWTRGRHAIVEMGCGLACYVSALPWVGVSLVVTLQLMKLAGAGGVSGGDDFVSGGGPTHPILDWVATSGWGGRALVLLVACVAAPIIEETMFRGVVYRHLREASARWRVGLSVAFSVVANSFLFAAIHPQGLFGIPVLMTLAAAFSLTREWRGSLLGPMTAHAFNNGMATLLLFQVL